MERVIDFRTVSPLYEMERDGQKPFSCRLFDYKDRRFRALAQWRRKKDWLIRITNPATGESFCRSLEEVRYMETRSGFVGGWLILFLGEKV